MSSSGGIDEYLEKINEKFGKIDVIICGQSWPPDNQEIEDMTTEYWNGVNYSNLTRSFQLMQKALPIYEEALYIASFF
jgi:NAD(P)-dependent dehydrogenase (short-subunit alcohol dehydrogenase family)